MNKKLIGGITAGVVALAVIAAVLISGVLGGNDDKPSNTPVDSGQPSTSITEETTESSVNNMTQVEDVKENMTTEGLEGVVEKLSDRFEFKHSTEENMFVVGEQYRLSYTEMYVGTEKNGEDTIEVALDHRINGAPGVAVSVTTTKMSEDEVKKLIKETLEGLTSTEVVDVILKTPYDTVEIVDATTEVDDESDLIIQNSKLEDGDMTFYVFGATYSVHSESLSDEFMHNDGDMRLFRMIPAFEGSTYPDVVYPGLYFKMVDAAGGEWAELTSYGFKQTQDGQSSTLTFDIKMPSGEKAAQSFSTIYSDETSMVYWNMNLTTGYTKTMDEAIESALKMANVAEGMEIKKTDLIESEKTDKFAEYSYFDMESEVLLGISIKYETALGYYALVNVG